MSVTKQVVEQNQSERRVMTNHDLNKHRRADDKKIPPDEELDHGRMGKGKYFERSPNWVAEEDPGYLIWAYENWTKKPCSKLLYDACVKERDEGLRQQWVSKDQDYE